MGFQFSAELVYTKFLSVPAVHFHNIISCQVNVVEIYRGLTVHVCINLINDLISLRMCSNILFIVNAVQNVQQYTKIEKTLS